MRYRRTEFVPGWVKEFYAQTWLLPTYSRGEELWKFLQFVFWMAIGGFVGYMVMLYGLLGGPEAAMTHPAASLLEAIVFAIAFTAVTFGGMLGLPVYMVYRQERKVDMVRDARDWIEREMSCLFGLYWPNWKDLEWFKQHELLFHALAMLAHLVHGASGQVHPVIKANFRQGRALAEFLLNIAPDSEEAEALEIGALIKAYPLDPQHPAHRLAWQLALGRQALEAQEQRDLRATRAASATR